MSKNSGVRKKLEIQFFPFGLKFEVARSQKLMMMENFQWSKSELTCSL